MFFEMLAEAPYRIPFAGVNLLRSAPSNPREEHWMVHRSLQSLALDKRLIRRRGWIPADKLEQELAGLPDVSDRIAEPEEELEEQGSGNEGEVP
jgi:hypothetical protein